MFIFTGVFTHVIIQFILSAVVMEKDRKAPSEIEILPDNFDMPFDKLVFTQTITQCILSPRPALAILKSLENY